MWPSAVLRFDVDAFLCLPSKGRSVVHARKGQVIFSEGDEDNSLFFIHKGTIQLVKTSASGKEAILAILGRGTFFGESCITQKYHGRRSCRAVAMTDLELVRIDRSAMVDILRASDPSALYCFLSDVIRSVSATRDNLASNLLYPSGERLVRLLLQLAEMTSRNKPVRLPNISQQNLADMIGATRQHVNAHLKNLRSLGFIEYSSGLRNLKVKPSLAQSIRKNGKGAKHLLS